MERPLRLNFQTSPARIDAALGANAVTKLDESTQQQIHRTLRGIDASQVWKDRAEFDTVLGKALGAAGIQVGMPVRKALLAGLGERDETAEACTDAKGNIEPDPKLRDYENVPLDEDIHEYFAREVTPHVPEAWIDESKTKLGYEIPFTRHFYEYIPPRTLEDIDADVKRLIGEIQALFAEVET